MSPNLVTHLSLRNNREILYRNQAFIKMIFELTRINGLDS